MEQRIVAFDIGDKRIGVAISDPFNEYAMPSQTYWRTGKFTEDVNAIAKIAAESGAGTVVCGLPVNFDGTESVQTQKTAHFIEALKKATSLPVVTEDERFTTMEATRVLIEGGVRREKRKNSVDSIAASYILEGYLSKINKEKQTMSMKEESNDYEEDSNIVELIDEDGNTLRYEHVGTIEYKGEWYCFFTPEASAEESDDEDEGEEVAVFRLVGDEDNETLEIVDDEDLLDEVFAEFCNQYEYAEDADDAEALEPDEDDE
jgi:putative Holliday junction resolvase